MASEIASLRDELRRLNEQHRYLQENTTSSRGVRGGQARVLEEFSNKLARAEVSQLFNCRLHAIS